MDFTGHFNNIGRDFYTGEYIIDLRVYQDVTQAFEKFKRCEDLDIVIKKHRKKRSLDANAYYWQLLSKLAEALHVSKPFMHNHLLRQYGQTEYYDGRFVTVTIPDTDTAQKKADEDEYTHLKPTSQVRLGNDGVMYRTYKLLRGSHSYNTKEMSELIDGLVSECKQAGIETMTPDELDRLKGEWKKYEQKNKVSPV